MENIDITNRDVDKIVSEISRNFPILIKETIMGGRSSEARGYEMQQRYSYKNMRKYVQHVEQRKNDLKDLLEKAPELTGALEDWDIEDMDPWLPHIRVNSGIFSNVYYVFNANNFIRVFMAISRVKTICAGAINLPRSDGSVVNHLKNMYLALRDNEKSIINRRGSYYPHVGEHGVSLGHAAPITFYESIIKNG